ncbi:MAG TPA: SDR family oxidoreductase [Phycisphaerales bacterium]|nr:SDR family oxidoreductase [Phycisphaerales bacterium]
MASNTTVALITGGNKGIGLETARQLAAKGAAVIVGARDKAKGEAAAAELRKGGADAHAVVLDVTDGDTLGPAARFIEQKWGRLDVLVNNAGISRARDAGGGDADGPPSIVSQRVLREVFDTNFFGLVAATQAFLPLVRKSAAGRVVNLSSILGSMAKHQDPKSPIYGYLVTAYNTSKAAVNMYTVQLAHELRDTPIKVNAVHPGWVKTDMGGPEAPMNLVDGARTSVAMATLGADGPTGGYFHMGERLPW